MPHIDTVPLESLAQSSLRSLVDQARDLKVPDALFFRLWRTRQATAKPCSMRSTDLMLTVTWIIN